MSPPSWPTTPDGLLEAAFLGVLLFGRKLLPSWAYFFSALMIGTLYSAFWILAANSSMQTPAGFEIIDGADTHLGKSLERRPNNRAN